MIDTYKQVLKENASVRRTEELVRRSKNEAGQKDEEHKPRLQVSKDIDRWTKELNRALGKDSDVKIRRSFRQTQVNIKLNGSIQDTQKQLDLILSIANKQKS